MYLKFGSLLRLERTVRYLSTTGRAFKNHYDVLGLKPWATATDIKMAYYEKTKLYHPDIVSATEENVKIFREISEAYEVLGSPTSRKEYDEKVLGIIREDLLSDTILEEDPIETYKRKKAEAQGSLSMWTKERADILRKKHKAAREPEVTYSRAPPSKGMIIASYLVIVAFVYTLMGDPYITV